MKIEGFYLNEFEILILYIKSSPTNMTIFHNSLYRMINNCHRLRNRGGGGGGSPPKYWGGGGLRYHRAPPIFLAGLIDIIEPPNFLVGLRYHWALRGSDTIEPPNILSGAQISLSRPQYLLRGSDIINPLLPNHIPKAWNSCIPTCIIYRLTIQI